MSGTHIDPGGDIFRRAQLHICMIVTFLKNRKNVLASVDTDGERRAVKPVLIDL